MPQLALLLQNESTVSQISFQNVDSSPLHGCLHRGNFASKIKAMNINQRFGQRIKEIRKAKGLSQEKLANLAEVDRTYMPEVERGERNISLVVAEKIANALGEKLSSILKD